jgi:uncharacterized protein with PhoU and TrkA domain
MKDVSQLMLDLAYSALFLRSRRLAREVVSLQRELEKVEDEIFTLLFHVGLRGISREELLSLIDIVDCFKDAAHAATGLANLVLMGKKLHPIIRKAIEESEETVLLCKVSAKSILAGKTLGELQLRTRTGVDVVTIRRGRRWIIDPKKNTLLLAGDVLIGIGTEEPCQLVGRLASGRVKKF